MGKKVTVLAVVLCLLSATKAVAEVNLEGGEYTAMTGTVNTALSGAIPQASTDLFSGAFNTSYAIKVPAGRRNIQPDIKLNYNSRSGNGPLGLGWSMPVASITRGVDNGLPKYDSTDKFFYCGQELVQVETDTYRLRVESGFMIFKRQTSNSNGTSYTNAWTVTDLNGTDYYFGASPNNVTTFRTGKDITSFNGTFQWYLVEVEDIFQNYMTIEYTCPSGSAGVYYVWKMRYTGKYGVSSLAPYYKVEFAYEGRSDSMPFYRTGYKVEIKHRISTITLYGNSSELISRYTIGYEQSNESGQSLLVTIQMTPASGATTLPPTHFVYHSPSSAERGWVEQSNAYDSPLSFMYPVDDDHKQDSGTRLIDLNGDGLVDIIRLTRSYGVFISVDVKRNTDLIDSNTLWVDDPEWESSFNPIKGYPLNANWLCFADYYLDGSTWKTNPCPMQMIDINGDNKPDILYADSSSSTNNQLRYQVLLNTSNGDTLSWAVSDWAMPVGLQEAGHDNGVRFGDINGDGLTDILRKIENQDDVLYLNNGSGFTEVANYTLPSKKFIGCLHYWQFGLRMFDLNGDGLADLLYSQEDQTKWTDLNNGTGFSTLDDVWNAPKYFNHSSNQECTPYDHGVRFLDANGDHLLDMITMNYDEDGNHRGLYTQYLSGSTEKSSRWKFRDDYDLSDLPLFMHGRHDTSARSADVNGDGLVDILNCNPEIPCVTYLNRASIKTDLLVAIDNGQGVISNIDYASSHSREFLGNSYCNADDNRLPSSVPVVASLTTKLYNGSTYAPQTRTDYVYCGGYLYAGNVTEGDTIDNKTEFRGFGHVVATTYNVSHGDTAVSMTETWYNQDRGQFKGYLIGTVDTQESYVFDSSTPVLVGETHTDYTTQDIYAGSTISIMYTWADQTQSIAWDGSSIDTIAQTDYSFLPNGLIEKTQSAQGGLAFVSGDEKFTETEFSYNTTDWIQKIKRTWMTTTLEEGTWNEDSRLSEKRFYYDTQTIPGDTFTGKGLLTKVDELLTTDLDADPETVPGGTYITTWWTANGANSYDYYGNLTDWYDFGVHKKFTYDSTVKIYPTVAETFLGSTVSHKVATEYDLRFGAAIASQGPYTDSSPAGIRSRTILDEFGRPIESRVIPVSGDSLTVGTTQYIIRKCAPVTAVSGNTVTGGCTSAQWPPLKTVTFTYDGTTAVSDTSTLVSVKIADAAGRVIQVRSEAATVGSTQYQRVSDTQYDALGRTDCESAPYFVQTTSGDTAYSGFNSSAPKTCYDYDNRGRMVTTKLVHDGDSVTLAEVEYRIADNLQWKQITDAEGGFTQSYQDIYGRVTETLAADGATADISTVYTYDGLNNLVTTTIAGGDSIAIHHDSLSRKTWMRDPDMGVWEYEYDDRGNLKCQWDVGSLSGGTTDTATCYDYDPINRVKRKFYQARSTNVEAHEIDNRSYSTTNNFISIFTQDNPSAYAFGWTWTYYMYDNYDGDTCEVDGNYSVGSYGGNALGRLTRTCNLVDDNLDENFVFVYDNLGRKVKDYTDWSGLAVLMQFQYDRLGRVTDIIYPQAGSTLTSFHYTYNNGGELHLVESVLDGSTSHQTDTIALWGTTTSSGYNERGQEEVVTYGNGVRNSWTYDAVTGKLATLQTLKGDTAYQDFNYTIDDVGNITGIENNLQTPDGEGYLFGNINGFEYDGLHRLKSVTIDGYQGNTYFDHTYDYAYTHSGNLTQKTNIVNGVATPVSITYSGNRAIRGVVDGHTAYTYEYDHNGNRTIRKQYAPAQTWTGNRYWYDLENRMTNANIIESSGDTIGERVSDQFYHLDGSRMWEGAINLGAGNDEGYYSWNQYLGFRYTNDGSNYWVGHVYANGRHISEWDIHAFDLPLGCSMSTLTRLQYVTYPALFLNFVMLLFPIILFVLIRGWFFAKSWRKHRLRNTMVVMMMVVFGIQVTPLPAAAAYDEPVVARAIRDRLRDRLALMYGGEENVPLLSDRVARGYRPYTPPAGENNILRESALYFAPDRARPGLERAWTRAASVGGASRSRLSKIIDRTLARWDAGMKVAVAVFGPREARAWSSGWDGASRMHFFSTDHLGSTRVVTDRGGNVFERIDYSPFGEIFRDDIFGGTENNWERHREKYTGQTWDYLTGLYYYGARYYDPEIGRFTSADTVVPQPTNGQTYNRYAYCYNNPYRYIDPSGHFSIDSILSGLFENIGGYLSSATSGINTVLSALGAAIHYGMAAGLADDVLQSVVWGVNTYNTASNYISGTYQSLTSSLEQGLSNYSSALNMGVSDGFGPIGQPDLLADAYSNVRGLDALNAFIGLVGNSLGMVAGIGLIICPDATMTTKILGYAVASKSLYGIEASLWNMSTALVCGTNEYDAPSSLTRYLANLSFPGNGDALLMADAADLTLDLCIARAPVFSHLKMGPATVPFDWAHFWGSGTFDAFLTVQGYQGLVSEYQLIWERINSAIN